MTDIDREAVILDLVANNPGVGKVKIQKECYFLQEALGIPLGFEFVMHHYGPYSFELDDMIEELGAKGSLTIRPYISTTGYGFNIDLGPKVGGDVPSLPSEVATAIGNVANFLSPKDAREAELWATTHFVHSILKGRGISPTEQEVIRHVKKLKPKFPESEIGGVFDQLLELGLF